MLGGATATLGKALAESGTDDPATFAAYLRTLGWNTATAGDRDLFQAPFRAGIQLNAYQLLPLRKALRLPRVNLLIADDVGLGKTVEAGLIVRELLLRRRIDLVVVSAPAGMVPQWQDELEAKFGLAFTIMDREHMIGFPTHPWFPGEPVAGRITLPDLPQSGRGRDLRGRLARSAGWLPATQPADPGRGAPRGAFRR